MTTINNKQIFLKFTADKWNPNDAVDGPYLWLPVTFNGDDIAINLMNSRDLSVFDKARNR